MKLIISEKQLQQLVKMHAKSQELSEEGEDGAPEAGTSSDGEKKTGMPKWESGIKRGPANQIAVTRWKDIEGTTPVRGSANTLWEQESGFTRQLDKQYSTVAGAEKTNSQMKELFADKHTINLILGIGSAFIPIVGPFISAGIGLYDAKLYYDEGDKKTAGMVAMFSLLPGIGTVINKIPGIKQLGSKGMVSLASKLAKGVKITNPEEIRIINGIAKNRQLIQTELNNSAKELSIKAARVAAQKTLKKQAVKQTLKKGSGDFAKTTLKYGTLGVGYDKAYDKLVGPEKMDISRFKKSKEKIKYTEDDMVQLPDGTWQPND